MKITIEVDELTMAWAERYTLDPALHAQQMFDHWAQLAQQENPGKKLEEVLTCKAKNDASQQKRDKQLLAQKSEQEKTEAAKLDAEKEQAAQRDRDAKQAALDARAAETVRDQQIKQAAKELLAEMLADGSVILKK